MIPFLLLCVLLVWVATRQKAAPMTLAQIDQLHDQLITEAFDRNISVGFVDADSDEPEEAEDEDRFIENPRFDIWCAEQAAHMQATGSAAEVAHFERTGKFPRGFKYTRKAPAVFLEEVA